MGITQEDLNAPLLEDPNNEAANDGGVPATLGELGACCPQGGLLSVKAMEHSTPDEALKLLSENGVKTLGTLVVQDAALKEALGNDGDDLLTVGSNQLDTFDWQRYWENRLSHQKMTQKRKKGWSNQVNMLARVITVEGATQPGAEGLIRLAMRRYQANDDASIFTIPAVEGVITFKWNAFARQALYLQLAFYLIWLFGFTGFTWLFQDEGLKLSLHELLQTSTGVATVLLEAVALVGMTPFMFIEIRTVYAYGLWQWATIWNLMDLAAYVLQILITVVHLQRTHVASNWLSIVLATQCLLLWAKVQYFSRVLQATSTSFVDTLKAVISDVRYFLAFLVLTFYSFAAAFHILFRKDQKEIEGFSSFLHTIGSIFAFATGGPDMDALWSSSVPAAATWLCIIYNFVMAIVLLNLLIAVMSDSYSRIMDHEEGRYRSNQASMIDELEATIPTALYNYRVWAPRYVHLLQREDDANGSQEEEAADELRTRVEQLEEALGRLEGMMGRIEEKLDASLSTGKGRKK